MQKDPWGGKKTTEANHSRAALDWFCMFILLSKTGLFYRRKSTVIAGQLWFSSEVHLAHVPAVRLRSLFFMSDSQAQGARHPSQPQLRCIVLSPASV